jgi:MSHA biogenesis protein MshQ
MNRSITANFSNYISIWSLLTWGVFFNETNGGNGHWQTTDYVRATVTYNPGIGPTPTPTPTPTSPPWYNSGWLYRKEITLNASEVPSSQTNFPVLISFASDSDLAADAQDDGDDILFTSGMTKLNHEIERFNGSTGELKAWVNVTSLSSRYNTKIYMYYGNSTCGNQQNITGVWDSNFVLVQHLDETSGLHYDSTSNGNNGTVGPGVTRNATGMIDGADDFTGTLDHVNVSDSSSLDMSSAGSLEAWINISSYKDFAGVIHKGELRNWSDEAYSLQFWYAPVGRITLYVYGTVTQAQLDSNTVLSTGAWYHVVGTWDAGGMQVCVNGRLDTSGLDTTSARNTAGGVNIGSQLDEEYNPTYLNCPFDGIMDEVRISKVARSADWIETCYNNQHSPSTFYTVGSEEHQ